jgi:hypothetical protein
LSQAQWSNEVVGNGAGLDIKGFVSSKKVFLLFYIGGDVNYSVELTAEGENKLAGGYARHRLTEIALKKPIILTK